MTDTFNSIHQAFVEHRSRKRIGPYPRELKTRALQELTAAELTDLRARLKLTAAQLERWHALYGGPDVGVAQGSKATVIPDTFYEVQMPAATQRPDTKLADVTVVEIAVELRNGTKVRVSGALGEDFVMSLVASMQ